MGRQNGGTAN